jgi:hypothetical protein
VPLAKGFRLRVCLKSLWRVSNFLDPVQCYTPLYRLKTPSQQIAVVLTALAEGLDASAAERVFGYRQATITTWLSRAGQHAQSFHEHFFCHLQLAYVQLGELRKRLCSHTHVLWLRLVIDPQYKYSSCLASGSAHATCSPYRDPLSPTDLGHWLPPALHLRWVRFLFLCLEGPFWPPAPGESPWQESTSVARGSGADLRSGEEKLPAAQAGTVTPVMRLLTEAALKVTLQGLGHSGRLNTAFIERVNLTVHHAIAALARRSWDTSQQASQLLAHLEWWRAYYHFVRPHQALRVALVQPRERGGRLLAQRSRQQTPAMAAGRTNRRWNVREVLSYPLLPVSA